MATVIEEFVATLGWDVDNSQLIAAQRRMAKLDGYVTKAAGSLTRLLKRGFFAAAAGGTALGGAVWYLSKQFSKIEDAEAAFTPLLGSTTRAQELVEKLNQTAATTPFQFENLSDVAQTLLPIMNGNIDKTVSTLRMLGDTAGGNLEKFKGIALGYSKAFLKGKVDMESLNIIGEKGVPIIDQLAKMYGKSTKQVLEMVRRGKVGLGDLNKVFENMTSEGGIFFKAMGIASATLTGRISTLKDEANRAAGDFGKILAPYVKQLVDELIKVAQKAQVWIKANRELIKTKVVAFIKQIPVIISKIVYWVPKIAKLVGVFYAIAAAVKVATVAMNAFIVVKAVAGKLGVLKRLIPFFTKTLPAAIGKSGGSIKGLGKSFGLVTAAIAGWEIGTLLHDELIEPLLEASDKVNKIMQGINATLEFGPEKLPEYAIEAEIKNIDKARKAMEDDLLLKYGDVGGFVTDIRKFSLGMAEKRLKGALRNKRAETVGRHIGEYERAPTSDILTPELEYMTPSYNTTNVSIAEVKSEVNVPGTSASPSDVEKASRRGMEGALDRVKRNMGRGD